MALKVSLRSIALVLAGCSVIAATAVEAAPLSVAGSSTLGLTAGSGASAVEQVAYRRRVGRYYGGGYYRRGYNPGGAIAAGAALGLIGAGVAAAAAPRYYGYPAYGAPYGYGYGPRYYGY